MKNIFLKLAVIAIVATLSSCVKKEFDNPPSTNVDPAITANTTILQLKALADTTIQPIKDDIIISGIVNSDDRSGNIYKTIIFQDATAGILINVDLSNFYALFPKGRKIFVKCKGLYISKVHGVVQLGVLDNAGSAPSLGRVPQGLIDTYIFRGVWNQTVTPIVVLFDSVKTYKVAYENMLVTINNVQFTNADTAKPYANAVLQASEIHYISACNGNSTIEVYTSGFATFASSLIPSGYGSITGIYQGYQSSPNYSPIPEMILRDLNDVNLSSPRCGVITGGGPIGTGGLMSIAAVRALGSGKFVTGTKIRGVVTSDKNNGNISLGNVVMQDGTAGIVVRFPGATLSSLPNLNDSIEINISSDSLVTFSGLLEINYATTSSFSLIASGVTVVPRTATISSILANQFSWESTLLKITGVTLTGGGTYGSNSGNVTMTDVTGSMELFTKTGATFASSSYPTTSVSVTGYLSHFYSTPELSIRAVTDVQ